MCNHIADIAELLCSLLRLVICTLLRVLYLQPCKSGLEALPCSVACSREGDKIEHSIAVAGYECPHLLLRVLCTKVCHAAPSLYDYIIHSANTILPYANSAPGAHLERLIPNMRYFSCSCSQRPSSFFDALSTACEMLLACAGVSNALIRPSFAVCASTRSRPRTISREIVDCDTP